MKAVVAYNNKAVLVEDRPPPKLRDEYVLVKVASIALNPTDWKHLDRKLVPDGCLIGCDFAGTVEKVGKGVTKKFAKGEHIAGVVHGGNPSQPEDGAFAEYIVAKGDICLKIPFELQFVRAATLPLGIGTVMQGLYQKGLNLSPPDNPVTGKPFLLIYGGSTATGALGVQFAKLSGYTVISTCSRKNFGYVKSLGADDVFDYNEPTVGPSIRAFTNNRLKLVWDTISNAGSGKICAEALSSDPKGCRYASFLTNKSPRADIVSVGTNLYTIWGEHFKTGEIDHPAMQEDFDWARRFMRLAEDLLFQGKLQPHRNLVGEHGLEGAVGGLEELKTGMISGEKLVYRIEDTP